ncbi:hypothetical protein F5X99DRAFT_311402 [Biscogniauxia marginata]|nr:hypothetical protein F5X99DRAFT_311402 [Biscogniauxia marginata]
MGIHFVHLRFFLGVFFLTEFAISTRSTRLTSYCRLRGTGSNLSNGEEMKEKIEKHEKRISFLFSACGYASEPVVLQLRKRSK